MTAIELAKLGDSRILKQKSIDELKDIRRQAQQAYATVGDSPKFTKTLKYPFERSFNTLEQTFKLADTWIAIKEGR